jgi:hypothetical protein
MLLVERKRKIEEKRRTFICRTLLKTAIAIGLGLSVGQTSSAEVVMVLIPSTMPVAKIEKQVKPLTSATVTAFAKYSDFEAAVESLKPEVLISSEAMGMSVEGFEKAGTVKINGEAKSKYIFLALDPSWKGKDLSTARIGVVEFIRRNKIKDYFDTLLGKKFKPFKTVSKVEDLYPLLVFKMVDVIAMQPYNYEELKTKFNTTVHEVGSSPEVDSLSIFQRGAAVLKPIFIELNKFDFSLK